MTTARIELPPKLIPVFIGSARYRGAYGGRGSGKTRSFATMSAVRAYELAEAGESGVILCGREFQNSLDESSMEEVKQSIWAHDWLADYFDVGEKYIRTKNGRIKYVFTGLRHNIESIKSKARILLAWVDEAEPVSEVAWRKLIPTVREAKSELWVTWNPEREGSATDKRFRQEPPQNSKIVEINYDDNPWFPDTLEADRQDDRRRLDDATYAHIWEGAYLENSEAQVLHGKVRVREFEPDPKKWDGPYYGLDYGFAQDPTAAVECWTDGDNLYIRREVGGVGVEITDTADMLRRGLPGIDGQVVRADNARPEMTSHLRKQDNLRVESAPKWSGSVEDGVAHLRGYREIIIHPECSETIRETRLYSHKVDRQTGDIRPDIVDAHNHYIDAIRYALAPMIRQRGAGMRGLTQW